MSTAVVNRQALHRTIDGPLAMFVWNETNSPTMAAKAPNPAAVATVAPNDRRTSRAVAAGMTMTAAMMTAVYIANVSVSAVLLQLPMMPILTMVLVAVMGEVL